MSKLMPRQKTPELKVKRLSGDVWDLDTVQPENFTLVVFYRGLHCPVCRTYIGELDRLIGADLDSLADSEIGADRESQDPGSPKDGDK